MHTHDPGFFQCAQIPITTLSTSADVPCPLRACVSVTPVAHINVFWVCSEDVGAGGFGILMRQSAILPTVEQQFLPFSLQGKAVHPLQCVCRKNHGPSCGDVAQACHLSHGLPFFAFPRGTCKVFCSLGVYLCVHLSVHVCAHVRLACAHIPGGWKLTPGVAF